LESPGHDDFELWSPSEERPERCLFGRQVRVLSCCMSRGVQLACFSDPVSSPSAEHDLCCRQPRKGTRKNCQELPMQQSRLRMVSIAVSRSRSDDSLTRTPPASSITSVIPTPVNAFWYQGPHLCATTTLAGMMRNTGMDALPTGKFLIPHAKTAFGQTVGIHIVVQALAVTASSSGLRCS
jgi:hypothetical protein